MTSFLQTFSGSPVSPSEVAYASYSFSTNLTLYWPQFSYGQTDIAARFMNLTATVGSLNVFMPDATLVSVGYDVMIFNAGAQTFNVVSSTGAAIATIAAGQTYYILLNDNTTASGTWQTVQFGVGTGSASAAALAGAGLIATAGLLNVNLDAAIVSNNYSITTADRAILQVWTGGAGVITLPTAASVGDGFFFALANNGSGDVTVTPSGGNQIDTESTSVFSQTQSGFIISTGTSWYTVGKGLRTNFAVTLLNLNVAGSSDITETSAQAQNIIQQFTGLLTGNINVIMPNTVQLYYIFNNTSGVFTLTVKTAAGTGVTVAQGTHSILYCDGTNILNAFTSTFGGAISISPGSANSPNLNFIGSTSTGIYSPALNQLAITAGGFEVMNFISAASSVNYLQSSASATGTPVSISALGSDSNIGINYIAKGTGRHSFLANGGTTQFYIGNVASAVNQLNVTGAATGNSPILAASGSDTNINISYVAKGSGTHNFTGQIIGNLTGTVTGSISGNAATATALQTARTIGGVSFNGTANITVASATGGFTITNGLSLNGSSSGSTTINAAAVASGVLTLPAATDTLVGRATTDTLTNKTFDTAATGNSFSINGVAVTANTGTGAIVRTNTPTIATPTLTGLTTMQGIDTTGNVFVHGIASGSALTLLNLVNSGTTAGTEAKAIFQPSGSSARAGEIGFQNDGTNAIACFIRTSNGGAPQNSLQVTPIQGLILNSATGTTSTGDVNITGSFKTNGVALVTSPVRAWVNFIAGGTTINAKSNVTSITRNGAGDYTINFTTNTVDANYVVHVTVQQSGSVITGAVKNGTTPTTSSVNIVTQQTNAVIADPGTNNIYVTILGN